MKLRLVTSSCALVLLGFTPSAAQAVASKIRASSGPQRASDVACTAETTEALIRRFVRDYNHGRVAAMDRLWAPEPRFQWFSAGPPGARLGARAYVRSTLAAYFRARVRVHERIRLDQLGAGYDSKRRIVNFAGKLVRRADDLQPKGPHDFKGAADCAAGRPLLIVWSM